MRPYQNNGMAFFCGPLPGAPDFLGFRTSGLPDFRTKGLFIINHTRLISDVSNHIIQFICRQ